MSEKKQPAYASKAEAKEALTAAKAERKVAKDELRAFEKEHELAKGEDHSADEKLGKKWKKLNDMVEKKEAAVSEIEEAMKDVKAAKAERPSKYDYPADVVTAADKKKYRTKMRAAAAKAEKGTEEPKAKKGKNKEAAAEVGEAPANAETPKKKKKAVEAAPSED